MSVLIWSSYAGFKEKILIGKVFRTSKFKMKKSLLMATKIKKKIKEYEIESIIKYMLLSFHTTLIYYYFMLRWFRFGLDSYWILKLQYSVINDM